MSLVRCWPKCGAFLRRTARRVLWIGTAQQRKTITPPRVMNRCGYRRYDEVDGPHWYVFPESFKAEVCKGHDPKAVAALLHQRGYIEHGKETNRSPYVVKCDLPGEGRRRVYHILPAIMEGGSDGD